MALASLALVRPFAPALTPPRPTPRFDRAALAGRLVELSGAANAATLTAAVGLVADSQRHEEPVAWVLGRADPFFAPDVASNGVDLEALVVVRAGQAAVAALAADRLVRSGAFGLVVLDLGAHAVVPMPLQSRLVKLAQQHDTAVVFLTHKRQELPSLSSLISLRAEARLVRARDGSGFRCEVHVLKDKRCGPGQVHAEPCLAAPGLG